MLTRPFLQNCTTLLVTQFCFYDPGGLSLVSFTTSGQETDWACSFMLRAGSIPLTIGPVIFLAGCHKRWLTGLSVRCVILVFVWVFHAFHSDHFDCVLFLVISSVFFFLLVVLVWLSVPVQLTEKLLLNMMYDVYCVKFFVFRSSVH